MTKRRSLYIEGFGHTNPVPVAAQIGQLLVSGVITGRNPNSREMPESLDEQVVNVFTHVRALLAEAGGTTDDIIKMTFWLADYRDRDALNREWEQMFPDPSNRPARQAMAAELDNGSRLQCDLIAVLD